MKAGILTVFRYPGYLNLQYSKPYKFTMDGKKVSISLNKLTKGIKIIDNENFHEFDNNKTRINKPVSEFTKGHFLRLEQKDKSGNDVNKEDWLTFSVEPNDGRDLFILENFFTEFLIIVEFDGFDKNIFAVQDKRARYNVPIFKAFNHFVSKYNIINKSGTLFNLVSFKQGNNLSFIIRQTYFKIEGEKDFYDYIGKDTGWDLTQATIMTETLGINGMKGSSDEHIYNTTNKFEPFLKTKLSTEDSFLSNALQELQKQNFKHAFLEAFLAVEISVENFLTAKKKRPICLMRL